jgi:glycosyltransferase involved in cell wall biosynthesis
LVIDEPPEADIYILECFKNYHEFFSQFRPRNKRLVISLIHSSYPCRPAKYSDTIVTLTQFSHDYIKTSFSAESEIIPGGIDIPEENNCNYQAQLFGRITLNKPGKFHPQWNGIAKDILDKLPNSELHIFIDNKDELLEHDRAFYHFDIRPDNFEAKINALSRLSLAVFAHGDFEEVFPMGVLECMAAGLPVIYLNQPSMSEMIGRYQFGCKTIEELRNYVLQLLPDVKAKKCLGWYARKRAQEFPIDKMIQKWDSLLRRIA